MRIHHIGIVCKNIEKAIDDFKSLYNITRQSKIVYDDLQKAYLCLLNTDTGLDVEFISGEKVSNLLKTKTSYYHLCYTVEDLEADILRFETNGCLVVSAPKPAVLFGGKRVAFLMTSNGLIELLEE